MAQQDSSGPEGLLARVLEADRALREAQEAFFQGGDERALSAVIAREIDDAWSHRDHDEGTARLIRLADLLTELGGAAAARLLVRLLGHEEPAVRVAAGEGLYELGCDRYAEVARAIEAEVDKGADTVALAEAPFVLAELGEPGGVKICLKLLKHKDPDVVGAAIEGLAQLGDPSALKDIEALRNDRRELTVEEESDQGGVTVGDLAAEASEHLRALSG